MRNLFLLLLFISTTCLAQKTIPDYLSVPFPTELTGSDDGKTIAWVFNTRGSRNIFVAQAPAFAARQLTSYTGDDGMEISELAFTPDGHSLLFVRGNGTNSNGETANPAQLQQSTERILWRIGIDGTRLQEISKGSGPAISPDGKQVLYRTGGQVWTASLTDSLNPQKLFTARGFPAQIRWSPDGQNIAFVSNRGDHSFIGLYSFATKSIVYPDPTVDFESQPVWSPDGKNLAYMNVPNIHNLLLFTPIRSGNPWSIRMLNVSTGGVKELWKATPGKGSIFFDDIPVADNLLWWTVNDQLIFPYEKDGWQHLYALNAATKEARLLTPGEGEIENVVPSNDRQTLYYTTNINDINRRHIWRINMADGSRQQITTGKGIEWSPVITSNGLALLHSSAVFPAWPALYENGTIKNIGEELAPKNFPSTLVEPEAVTITAKDGLKFTADVFLPSGYEPGKKYPSVIFFHGGSRRQMLLGFHYSQYYSNAYALNEYFAANGYIALSVNYRSGIGYGMEFREAINYGAAGASEVNDVMAAGNYLHNRKDVAPGKIALWGGSYGGFLTAHGLARASSLFACGVDIHGVHNWNDEIPIFTSWYDYAKFPVMAQKALESSPIYYIKGWKSPVLLIHGDDDRNVYFSESVNIAEKLRQQNVHVEQLILPDEIHGFLLHKSWIKVYEAAFDFIERQLGRRVIINY
jgi:dipeptidyl aminopeptidase/acylaminoacyl peptidase